jgi:hypothetical protein
MTNMQPWPASQDRARIVSDRRMTNFYAAMISSTKRTHIYEVRPRKDKRGVDLISDALPFGRLWYAEPNAVSNAIHYVKFRSRLHKAVIHIYDEAGNLIETPQLIDGPMRMSCPFNLFFCFGCFTSTE